MAASLGRQFVEALAARDADRLAALFHPEVDFKGLTPGRFWEATTPEGILDAVLGNWFGEGDHIEAVTWIEDGDPVEDTQRLGYRVRVTNDDGPHSVEQQVYYRERDGRMTYARVVCSGYRRITA